MSDIAQKSQKLASAIYLVTGFFTDQDPMKWKLRQLVNDLVSLALSFKSLVFKEREMARVESREVVMEILALIEVGKNVGLISEGNFSVFKQEFDKYLLNIGFPQGLEEKDGQALLSSNFFTTSSSTLPSGTPPAPKEIKDNTYNEESDSKEEVRSLTQHYLPKRQLLDIPQISPKTQPKSLKEFGAVSVKKNSRQSIIINLLKRKKEIMIKDVSPLISGCSEKTIQRELLAMVAAGILRKVGEKRWSRYSLAESRE